MEAHDTCDGCGRTHSLEPATDMVNIFLANPECNFAHIKCPYCSQPTRLYLVVVDVVALIQNRFSYVIRAVAPGELIAAHERALERLTASRAEVRALEEAFGTEVPAVPDGT